MYASEYASSQVALKRVPRQPAIETQLDVVAASVQPGQHRADVVAKIALHFKDKCGGAPLGIRPLASLKSWQANGCIHADVLPDPTAPKIATPV